MNRSNQGLPVRDSAGLGMIETSGTNADEFKPMPDDFKIGILI
jgi:hypothetical protein